MQPQKLMASHEISYYMNESLCKMFSRNVLDDIADTTDNVKSLLQSAFLQQASASYENEIKAGLVSSNLDKTSGLYTDGTGNIYVSDESVKTMGALLMHYIPYLDAYQEPLFHAIDKAIGAAPDHTDKYPKLQPIA